MSRLSCGIVTWFGIWLAAVSYLHVQAAPPAHARAAVAPPVVTGTQISGPRSAASSEHRALLTRYCVSCHNPRLNTGGLSLDPAAIDDVGADAELWEKVVAKLRTGAMPPAGLPRPAPAAAGALSSWVEAALDQAAAANINPGRGLPLHRLNRAEYTNAVRDLLAIEIDGRSLLPVDDSNHGFDSMASVLTVSPMLLERYLAAARRISRLAIGDRTIGPAFASKTYATPLFQDDRMGEDLPFGSRGGLAVRHYFALEGDYVLRVRLQKNYVNYVRGLGTPHLLEVRLNGKRLRQFTIGGAVMGAPAPVSYAGNISGSAEWESYALAADQDLEVRFMAGAGNQTVGVSFVRKPGVPEGVLQPPQTGYALAVDESRSSPGGLESPAVESVAIDGPYDAVGPGDTPSRRRIFVCRPDSPGTEAACARTILERLARRAYRRPVTADDVQTLLGFYQAGRQEGDFDLGIQRALERLLVEPEFLFRIERDPPRTAAGAVYRISDLELASRLSFFLWSSIPDDELLDAAARGTLRDAKVLERQVRRMLADRRVQALVDNFAAQWLSLRSLDAAAPNPDLFPDFDENLREAFRRETELFIAGQLREDRSVVDLLTANHTFVNERLARHYGIPGIYGSHFRPVSFNDDRRGGLLGHGSILTVTSYGNRTSPVLRGHWLLENIIGSPPPPPPADVPGLAERGEDGTPRSVRERLEQHRKNPACASCHLPMDPLGFALENFDAIGRWRTTGEGGSAIDASGSLPDGTQFEGLSGLRAHVLKQKEQFVGKLAEKLLTYALGRGVEYYDRPALRMVTRQSAGSDYRWSSVILGIVKSAPFQMRRSET